MSGSGPTRRIEDWKPMDSGKADNAPGGGNAPTKKVDVPGSGAPGSPPGSAPGAGPSTIIAGAPAPAGTVQQPGSGAPPVPGSVAPADSPQNFMHDPVVGWLVITDGPGKGAGLQLGRGMNTIGRGETNRVMINYGDKSISREKHCIVTYEPKRRVYYIQNEGGTNLTYVGDAVVLQAQQLHNGEMIQIGDTHMRFVAFCGEDFAWEDENA